MAGDDRFDEELLTSVLSEFAHTLASRFEVSDVLSTSPSRNQLDDSRNHGVSLRAVAHAVVTLGLRPGSGART